MAIFLKMMPVNGLWDGLLVRLAVGLGLIGFSMYNTGQYEQRSFRLSLINVGYRVVYFTVVGNIKYLGIRSDLLSILRQMNFPGRIE